MEEVHYQRQCQLVFKTISYLEMYLIDTFLFSNNQNLVKMKELKDNNYLKFKKSYIIV